MATKLRLWQATKYSRILYMDADTVLTGDTDSVFADTKVRAASWWMPVGSRIQTAPPLPQNAHSSFLAVPARDAGQPSSPSWYPACIPHLT